MADRRDEIEGTRSTWPSLIRRLRQRKLVQWTLAYAAAAFAVLQLIDLLGNRFAWPDAVVRSVIVLIGAGLLLTIVLAWYHGERGRQRVEGGELLVIAGICALALAGIGTQIARSDAGANSVGSAPGTGSGGGSVDGARGEATAGNGIFAVPAASNSIAVLPFANVGEDPDLEYFSDGLTDELTGALSKVPGLKVAARTSAFRFKGTNPDAREVGRALGVASVLDGSVRIVGERLRVTATLVGTADGYHIWSERYDGDLVDIFAIQDEISLAIVDALRIQLRPVLAPATAPPSLEAYELYLRGRYFANRRSEESLVRAAAYFERAMVIAPDYAPPYAGLADTYIAPRRSRPEERFRRGKEAALRALALDSTLSEAHTSLGWIRMWYDRDWAGARASFERAMALDPNSVWAHQWYSAYLGAVGRVDDAMVAIRRAHALDPLAVAAITHVGTHHLTLHPPILRSSILGSARAKPRLPGSSGWSRIAARSSS
jgi:adenylate cyclase